MPIDDKLIHEFAHGSLKIVETMRSMLEMWDRSPTLGLHNPKTRETMQHSMVALGQVIQDLRTLAIASESTPGDWVEIDWKSLISEKITRAARSLPSLSFTVAPGNYAGSAQPELLSQALGNLLWFTRTFAGAARATLSATNENNIPWIRLTWQFDESVKISEDFGEFRPFYPMAPGKSLALATLTGLSLHVVREIAQLHGGRLTAQHTPNLQIRFESPLHSRRLLT